MLRWLTQRLGLGKRVVKKPFRLKLHSNLGGRQKEWERWTGGSQEEGDRWGGGRQRLRQEKKKTKRRQDKENENEKLRGKSGQDTGSFSWNSVRYYGHPKNIFQEIRFYDYYVNKTILPITTIKSYFSTLRNQWWCCVVLLHGKIYNLKTEMIIHISFVKSVKSFALTIDFRMM